MVGQSGHKPIAWLLALSIAAISIAAIFASLHSTPAVAGPIATGASYLFRFDANAQTFVTIPLPTGSTPIGVAVTGTQPTHVWLTEMGRNQIGHVIYTDTNDYQLIEYPVTSTSSSAPFRLTIDGNEVWFTERGANRIGRLDAATGQIDEFYGHGLSPNSGLSDIKVAPDGKVWASGEWSNRLIALSITSTTDYSFREYGDAFVIHPTGIAVRGSDDIWFASPGAHRVGWLWFDYGQPHFFYPSHLITPTEDSPIDLIYLPLTWTPKYSPDTGEVWFTDMQMNRVGRVGLGTVTGISSYFPISRPFCIANEINEWARRVVWITQQDDYG